MRKLDIGGGPIIRRGYERIDFDMLVKPDILWDLNKIPWPINNETYDRIVSFHTIEHLPEINPFLREVTRIIKDKGTFRFDFPHYSVAFIEPGHRRGYGCHALSYHKQFIHKKPRMEWSSGRENKKLPYRIINKVLTHLANKNPYVCERVWCYLVGGFSNVILEGHIDKSKMSLDWFMNDDQVLDVNSMG